jgi:hypothetical protein
VPLLRCLGKRFDGGQCVMCQHLCYNTLVIVSMCRSTLSRVQQLLRPAVGASACSNCPPSCKRTPNLMP